MEIKGVSSYLVLNLDDLHYAIPVSQVDRVVRAVEVTPIPDRPEVVDGIINVEGVIVPVINCRKRLHLPTRPMDISDKLVIARTSIRTVALVVDGVEGVICAQELEVTEAADVFPGLGILRGVLKNAGEMLLIQDLDGLLSAAQEAAFAGAVACNEEA